jgi:hypothetical protein
MGGEVADGIVFAGQSGGTAPLPLNVIQLYNRRVVVTGLVIGDRRMVTPFWADMRERPIDLPASLIGTFPRARG